MALLRILHAADLPDPGQLVRKLEQLAANPGIAAAAATSPAGQAGGGAAVQHAALDWEALVHQVEQHSPMTGASLRLGVRVVELVPGRLRYQLVPGLAPLSDAELRKALDAATGLDWDVATGAGPAQPSLEEQRESAAQTARQRMRAAPLVEAAFAAFPQAQIVDEDSSPGGGTAGRGERNWSRRA